MDERLTHLDDDGRARMIDVGEKAVTRRVAVARGRLETTAHVVALLRADGLPKADALTTARIAGIAGAKRTSDLIPLCHPLPLDAVSVDLRLEAAAVSIEARATMTGRTGVEMEALTAVAVAGLTLHDMVKAVDPAATMTGVQLVSKSGGRHGEWTREEAAAPHIPGDPQGGRVLVVSTGAAAGTRQDTTGPRIVEWLNALGLPTPQARIVADADVADALRAALADSPAVLITTGGTGASPTDATPEATATLLTRTLPGIAEALRARAKTPTAALGRGLAGVADRTVVVNLPGSTGGVSDGLEVLADVLPHLLRQLRGDTDHAHGAHQSPEHATASASASAGGVVTVALATVSAEPLDAEAVEAAVLSRSDGALVTFRGVIRDHDAGHAVVRLDYSAHPDAEAFLRAACERVAQGAGLVVAAAHRIGTLGVGDVALVAAVAAPHRAEAFAACEALVDAIKQDVPIWKRQHGGDGTTEWVGL